MLWATDFKREFSGEQDASNKPNNLFLAYLIEKNRQTLNADFSAVLFRSARDSYHSPDTPSLNKLHSSDANNGLQLKRS